MSRQVKKTKVVAAPVVELTPEQVLARKTERMIVEFEKKIVRAQNTLADFRTKLETNPTYALQWADSSFESAAIVSIMGHAVENLKKDWSGVEADRRVDLAYLLKYATEQALMGARHMTSNSSSSHNLMNQYETKVWAEIVDTAKWS